MQRYISTSCNDKNPHVISCKYMTSCEEWSHLKNVTTFAWKKIMCDLYMWKMCRTRKVTCKCQRGGITLNYKAFKTDSIENT